MELIERKEARGSYIMSKVCVCPVPPKMRSLFQSIGVSHRLVPPLHKKGIDHQSAVHQNRDSE